jgi:di/tricarboxylate transporter
MSFQLAQVLVLLVLAIAMFAMNRPRMDAVALLMLTLLPLTGVIDVGEALAGFSDPNIVLIAALFVIGDGLVRTGVARGLGDWLLVKAGSSELGLMVLLMVVVCGLGSMMSSTAVTAIFIPVALRICQTTGTSPSQLMMPLSAAALVSGMMTLIATAPNLVVNSELIRQGEQGFHLFSFTPFALPILVLAIIYMSFARRWLPDRSDPQARLTSRPSLADWVQRYKLADREYRLRVTGESPLVGQTLEELDLGRTSGASVVAIERMRRRSREILGPTGKTELHAGDVLLVDLYDPKFGIDELGQRLGVEPLPLTGTYFNDRSQEIGMAEVIVPAESELIGKTVADAEFRSRTGVTVLGLRRGCTALGQSLREESLRVGDTLLVVGPWKNIERLHPEDAGVLTIQLPADIDEVLPAPGKAPLALACLAVFLVLMVTGVVPNVHAALIACLLMGLFCCVAMDSAYHAIDWKTIILIVGMLPFSLALKRTGGVDLMADGLMAVIGGAGTYVVLASIFAMTAILGMFISNTATAVLMAPVALAVAQELDASPYPFAMIVALAASTAFMTPVSSPVNTLVVTPGNYTFSDFLRVGVPFAFIVMIACVFMVPLLLPL